MATFNPREFLIKGICEQILYFSRILTLASSLWKTICKQILYFWRLSTLASSLNNLLPLSNIHSRRNTIDTGYSIYSHMANMLHLYEDWLLKVFFKFEKSFVTLSLMLWFYYRRHLASINQNNKYMEAISPSRTTTFATPSTGTPATTANSAAPKRRKLCEIIGALTSLKTILTSVMKRSW